MNYGFITIALLFVLFISLRPLRLFGIYLNMVSGSFLAIIVLYFTQVIHTSTIKAGIIGNGSLRPWEIIIIFFSVAYITISVDITGVFSYFAYKVVYLAKGRGYRLFAFFYLFACILTTFTSNDIVILTLTPIIFYAGYHADINIIPLLFAEYFGANTFSMLLYIGNPTNIIVGNALGLNFFEYTRIMWLPTLMAGSANLIMLFLVFRKQITKQFSIRPDVHPRIENKTYFMTNLALLILMLISLAFSSLIGLPVWLLTFGFMIVFFLIQITKTAGGYFINPQILKFSHSDTVKAAKRVPWKILPFILAFFILVQRLSEMGFVDSAARSLSHASTTIGAGGALIGLLGLVLANIINNQPMTILLTSIIINNSFAVPQSILRACAYSLIISSNLGANISLIGALAGLMWKNILNTQGVDIKYLFFLKKGMIITPIVFAISLFCLLSAM